MNIALITDNFSHFSGLVDRLRQEPDTELLPVTSGTAAMNQLAGQRLDLVIVDEQLADMSGLACVKQLVTVNPLANIALVGTLAEDDFHEQTEGLGVLMQLPPRPGAAEAEALLRVLSRIRGLLMPGEAS